MQSESHPSQSKQNPATPTISEPETIDGILEDDAVAFSVRGIFDFFSIELKILKNFVEGGVELELERPSSNFRLIPFVLGSNFDRVSSFLADDESSGLTALANAGLNVGTVRPVFAAGLRLCEVVELATVSEVETGLNF